MTILVPCSCCLGGKVKLLTENVWKKVSGAGHRSAPAAWFIGYKECNFGRIKEWGKNKLLNFSEAIFVAGKAPQQAHSGATQLLGQRSRREKEAAQNNKLLFTHS
ncbi:MAG: hypothetical protein KAX50_00340 [Saprospiraceae bacterium]|nr:hypothetical protein [Saprospiraceae bacterium]